MSQDSSGIVPGGFAPRPVMVQPAPRRLIIRALVSYNPFYLLSACCMMIGLFTLNNGLDWSPLPTRSLLTLMLTLAIYEIALVGLGVLLVRRGVVRDGLFVLILEVFFLADAGFLNMEIFTANPELGLAVNGLLLGLAIFKLWAIVFVGLRLRAGAVLLAGVAMQLFLLYGTPGLFAHMAFDGGASRGELSPWAIYAGWVAFAAMPLVGVAIRASLRHRWLSLDPAQRIVIKTLVMMPAISMLAHLCLANWVYEVPFYLANIAPLLLGVAVLAGHWDDSPQTRLRRARLQWALPGAAIVLSLVLPDVLVIDMGSGWMMSPLRITLLAAAIVYLDGWWNLRYGVFLAASLITSGAGTVGASVAQMASNLSTAVDAVTELVRRLVPKSNSQWGVTSIVAAFVLLAIGAVVSWLGKVLRLAPVGLAPPNRSSENDDTVIHIAIRED